MMTSAYDKNALGKQERKHLLINQILKRLHEGHIRLHEALMPDHVYPAARILDTMSLHRGWPACLE